MITGEGEYGRARFDVRCREACHEAAPGPLLVADRALDELDMQAVVAGVEAGGGTTDVLPYSWRSRPALVDYVNEIYEPTFVGEMPAGQVGLEPKRKEQGEPAGVLIPSTYRNLNASGHRAHSDSLLGLI